MSLSTHPTLPPAAGHPAQDWTSAATLRERLARLDPHLDPASTTAQAALILLAGLRMEHNVVKVAKFAGLKVEFVARCARRLVDNGIWRSGETMCSWYIDSGDHAAFWADVAVAEGKLCRRLDEAGRPEWAPGGHWWKSFDLVRQSHVARADQCVLYHSPPPAPAVESILPEPEADEWTETDSGDLTDPKTVSHMRDEFAPDAWGPSERVPLQPFLHSDSDSHELPTEPALERNRSRREGVRPESGKAATDLFPGAVWL